MDPKKDKSTISIPLPGQPPMVSRERELPPPVETPQLDAEVSKIVQLIEDHTDQSQPIIKQPPVSVIVEEPKSQAPGLDERLLRQDAKASPSLPTTWKAVITLFERVKKPLKGSVQELSNS